MALTNPKLFGLNVLSRLSDVREKNTALQNIGINPLDLEIIRGAVNEGMSRFDWISFSRLNVPLFKTLDRFERESGAFTSILEKRAGTDQTLFGNLNLNGSISGSAIRYRYIDFDDGNKVKIADISTSRVSAWSSSDPRANNQNLDTQKLARISFGARVGIVTDGKLVFGTQSTATQAKGNASSTSAVQTDSEGNVIPGPAGQPRLQTSIVPEPVEFPSEVPTSRIKCKINGQIIRLYAMKGIPLVFKGFFRNLNATVTVNNNNPRVSWKIVETANENLFTNYKNRGSTTSSIRFRSPVSRERFIKVYKNPNEITGITIQSASISELPPTKLSACTLLNFNFNNIKILPNFAFIAPQLASLRLRRNPLYLSDIQTERNFNKNVLLKIPTSLSSLEMGGTFPGSIERNIFSARLPNLTSFDLDRGNGGQNLLPDTRTSANTQVKLNGTLTTGNDDGSQAFCPDVPKGVVFYDIERNGFRSVDLNKIDEGETANDSEGNSVTYTKGSFSFKMLPKLVDLNCFGNRFLNDADSLNSAGDVVTALESAKSQDGDPPTIENINYGGTFLGIPSNLENCTSLRVFNSTDNRGSEDQLVNNSTGTYLFNNCNALERISFYRTNLGQINFPNKFTNPVLSYIDLRYTYIKGGKPGVADASQTHVIHADTFEDAPELKNLYILSNKLLSGKGIEPSAFIKNPNLEHFRYYSYGRTSGGIASLFNTNTKLHTLVANRNAFTGSPPNFAANPSIRHVDLSYNQLDGIIPTYENLNSLRNLYLQNNQLTSLSEPGLLPALQKFQMNNNQLVGSIPDFSGCTNLRTLTLHRNNFTGYTSGAFKKLYRIRYLDISFNNLSQSALNTLLEDLLANWQAVKRGGVTINLKSQSGNVIPTPFGPGMDAAKILSNNGWDIGISPGGIQSNL
jgi:Leucine-rich repeat (LRR) protein